MIEDPGGSIEGLAHQINHTHALASYPGSFPRAWVATWLTHACSIEKILQHANLCTSEKVVKHNDSAHLYGDSHALAHASGQIIICN